MAGLITPRYYRIFYNLISILTLLPLVVWTLDSRGDIVFTWSGGGILIRFLLLAAALICFWLGARGYDLNYFLGLKQYHDGNESTLLGEDGSFSQSGIFDLVRHPWYVGALLLIWSANGTYYEKTFAVALILTLYIFVGTWLEERKIVAQYGERYRQYQKRVSMFLPVKWLLRKL